MLRNGSTAMDGTSGCTGVTTVGELCSFRSSPNRSVTDWYLCARSLHRARVTTLWADDDDPVRDACSFSKMAFESDSKFSPRKLMVSGGYRRARPDGLTRRFSNEPEKIGGVDETRTRDLRRDRPAF